MLDGLLICRLHDVSLTPTWGNISHYDTIAKLLTATAGSCLIAAMLRELKYRPRDFAAKWLGRIAVPAILWLLKDRDGDTLFDYCKKNGTAAQLFD